MKPTELEAPRPPPPKTAEDRREAPLPRAPDAGLGPSATTPRAGGEKGALPLTGTWHPDLSARGDTGMTKFTPVSTPWPKTWDDAVQAARSVKPLPELTPSVRAAESSFRDLVAQDPAGAAAAYLRQAKVVRARYVAELQQQVKAALAGLEAGPGLAAAAEAKLAAIGNLKPSVRAKVLETLLLAAKASELPKAIDAALTRVQVPLKIETDEIKLMSPHFNGTKVQLGGSPYEGADAAKIGPAIFNTALHPTATAVARLALELALNDLAPGEQVVVMAGGVAAGKGYAAKKANFDGAEAKLVFDPDGESSQTFLETLSAMTEERGLKLKVVGVVTDPIAAWLRAMSRAFEEGRTVSETAFAHSHTTGVDNLVAAARHLATRGVEVALVDNNQSPRVMAPGEAPKTMTMAEAYAKVTDITDSLKRTGDVPAWVREQYAANPYMMASVIEPLRARMHDPASFTQKAAIFDSLREDRDVFKYAHAR